MTMITPSYLGETIEYSSLHACRSTLEDPTSPCQNFGSRTFSGAGFNVPSSRRASAFERLRSFFAGTSNLKTPEGDICINKYAANDIRVKEIRTNEC